MDHLDVPGGGAPSSSPTPKPKKRRRRFGREDILIAIVIVGFAVTGGYQISVGNTANESSRNATQAVEGQKKIVRCLTGYSNALADALDRRTNDNQKLTQADSLRDDAVDALLERLLADPPGTAEEIRVALMELRATNTGKREAKSELDQGRKDVSYPEAPRDVCQS